MQYRLDSTLAGCAAAWPLIADLDSIYPDMSNWFWNRFVPGLMTGLDVLILARDERGQCVGVAMAQQEPITKLCCLRVASHVQGQGIGPRMLARMLDQLDTRLPLVTVSAEHIHALAPMLVRKFGFQLTDAARGLYRPEKVEYVFNGPTSTTGPARTWARNAYGGPDMDAQFPLVGVAGRVCVDTGAGLVG